MNQEKGAESESLNQTEGGGLDGATQEDHIASDLSQRQVKTMGIFGRIVFQKLLIFSLIRLIIYLNKLYQDGNAVNEYYTKNRTSFLIISIVSLVAPPLIYTIYLIGFNLAKEDSVDKTEVSTRAVNGLLLIPWQIKRHLDLLHFTAQRACQWRSPEDKEKDELKIMERNAEVLEFFEDFYAGFLQLLLQLYIWFGSMDYVRGEKLLGQPLIGQIVASTLSIFSMMIAVRRRDDGKLSVTLSFLGWFLIFLSRIVVFSLVSTCISYILCILCLIHVLAFSIWVYNIAVESYQISTSSPSTASAQWGSRRKRASIALLVVLFFGLPSLVFWPIMFQLKEGRRPLKFLLVLTLENGLLLVIWLFCRYFDSGSQLNDMQILAVALIVASTLGGVFFLVIYVLCKPKYADQVVLFKIRQDRDSNAPTLLKLNSNDSGTSSSTQYGIYYEFCDMVFKLPSTHKIESGLRQIRQLQGQTS